MLQYIKYVYLFPVNSGCLFSKYFFFIISFKKVSTCYFTNKKHLSVIKMIGYASFGFCVVFK